MVDFVFFSYVCDIYMIYTQTASLDMDTSNLIVLTYLLSF